MAEVLQAIREAWGNLHYLYLYGASLIILLIFLKGRRKLFVVPAIILTIGIINPIFFKGWNAVNGYAYWRTLWMIPVIPVCAAVPALFVEKGRKELIKICIVMTAVAAFAVAGTWISKHDLTRFGKPGNVEKLPIGAVNVANALLELDETPYVVADNDICIFLRQYSGNIHTMYARNVYFGESDAVAANVFTQLTSEGGNLQEVALTMLNNNYEYLVSKRPDKERQKALGEAGFEPVKIVNEYTIYRVNGNPTEIRKYNDLHQVTAVTTVNENGEAVNGPDGYATRTYEYDKWGRIIRRFQTDADGNGVIGQDGTAGYEVTFDRYGHITREIHLGADGNPIETNGYYVKICDYKGKKQISEKYYDDDGKPATVGIGYTRCAFEYTKDGQLSLIRYFDQDGQQVNAGSAFFHEYLQSLQGRDISIFISAKDEASNQMTVTLWKDMKALGIQTDLRGQFRKSFYAVVTPEGTQEAVGDELLTCSGMLGDIPYTVTSAGFNAGSYSSIMIGEKECSRNGRGLNIVVFDNVSKTVVETVAVDTFCKDMTITG